MVQKAEPVERDPEKDTLEGLSGEVGGLFLQAPPCAGMGTSLAGVRDSGYDSLRRRMSVLDRLVQTHAVWLQLGLSHQDATRILQNQPAGTFLVRKSSRLQRKVLSLRMDKDSETPVKDFPVRESQYTFSLEGSGLSFADLFRLVAFCCISRDVLPFILKLPEVISSAKTATDLEEVSKLGAGFWDSELSRQKRKSSVSWLSGTTVPGRPSLYSTDNLISTELTSSRPRLQTRTPSELDCCQSNGALCFINPLFIKVHHRDINHSRPPDSSTGTDEQALRDQPVRENTTETNNNSPRRPSPDGPHLCCSEQNKDLSFISTNGPQSLVKAGDVKSAATQGSVKETQNLSHTKRASRTPPPRPPPPRLFPRRTTAPHRQYSMPEKISWINPPKEKGEERPKEKEKDKEKGSSLLHRLGSSLTISPSSSPPKRLSISSPISIPRPSIPISFSSLSSSPRRAKSTPSPRQDDAQCHLALEDQTIQKALNKARLLRQSACATSEDDSGSPQDPSLLTSVHQREETKGVRGGERGEDCGGGQRLSDMSLSTDSSDSLDFSHPSTAFFLPPLQDPSLPTAADYNTHLPLSLPPPSMPYGGMEDEDDDEEEEDEEERDYGVSLESDQDQDLTMTPPGHRGQRRASASAMVLQRALRGHLRKMSGVFSSLLTPENRAIRKVVELSRNKSSYFGCLVQDYLSYLGEGAGAQAWQGHGSGTELLQTLRQFITQMKSYLRQSSELEPPIESFIPEDQIDQVLEKAMHKCVLKPLKGVVTAALREFQVRSGEWQELKENLSLAKAKHPTEMGVADTLPPDPVAVEKIKHKFHTMCKLYSPEKKVTTLLRVCKLIYTIMEDNSGRMYGADDFLPMLTYVLAQCDMPQLDNEILYMMELLDPSLLHGEGGYYLTSAYGAMSLLKNFQEEQAARVLSSETRNTLHQWHRRRTTQRSSPSVDDFQNYLRVALQELDSGCTAKTLQVRPYATTEEVSQLCAQKFKVSDPENYALFLLMEGSSQQLALDTHPQKIKAEIHSRPQVTPFYFVYRRMASLNGSSPVPLDATAILNSLALNSSPESNMAVNSDPKTNLNDLSLTLSVPTSEPNLNLGLSPNLSLSLPPKHLNGNSISV